MDSVAVSEAVDLGSTPSACTNSKAKIKLSSQMKAIAFKTAQSKLSKIIDSVILTNKPVKILRREKHQTAVVISKTEYKQLLETSYLLNNTKNATRLNRAIKSLSQ